MRKDKFKKIDLLWLLWFVIGITVFYPKNLDLMTQIRSGFLLGIYIIIGTTLCFMINHFGLLNTTKEK